MKLAEVRKHTGRKLIYAEAITLANAGSVPPQHGGRPVAPHLEQHPQDWLRLEAALVILHHKQRGTRR